MDLNYRKQYIGSSNERGGMASYSWCLQSEMVPRDFRLASLVLDCPMVKLHRMATWLFEMNLISLARRVSSDGICGPDCGVSQEQGDLRLRRHNFSMQLQDYRG